MKCTCIVCGKDVESEKYVFYCSVTCRQKRDNYRNLVKSGVILPHVTKRPCARCGRVMNVDISAPYQRYCGALCGSDTRPKQICLNCGNQFCGQYAYQTFCSRECHRQYQSDHYKMYRGPVKEPDRTYKFCGFELEKEELSRVIAIKQKRQIAIEDIDFHEYTEEQFNLDCQIISEHNRKRSNV